MNYLTKTIAFPDFAPKYFFQINDIGTVETTGCPMPGLTGLTLYLHGFVIYN